MKEFINEMLSNELTLWSGLFKVLLSMTLGSMIGIERRLKGQIAGLRTFALIAMGATLAMLISAYVPKIFTGTGAGDPGRIAAQVITGVGFLGAGAIIQMKGSVRGLTTAAGIWMTACIGLAVGVGLYLISIITTVLILFVLVNIERFEHRRNLLWDVHVVNVKINGIVQDLDFMRSSLRKCGVKLGREFIEYDYSGNFTIINFIVRIKDTSRIPEMFEKIHSRYDLASISLSNDVGGS